MSAHNALPPSDPAQAVPETAQAPGATAAKVVQLRPPSLWHDPLRLIQDEAPGETKRVVLRSICLLVLALIVWAAFGQLDIIVSAEGKLVPQTLVKIVQPVEAGVVKELLVGEGDSVRAGQVLARLDTTLARADKLGVASDLKLQQMQARRLEAELDGRPMLPHARDDPTLYAQVLSQYTAHRKAYLDGLEQERSLLIKALHERKSAVEIQDKLEQTLPTYKKTAEAYARLEKDGFIAGIAAAEKQREATEKTRDLEAQRASVAALDAVIVAQQKRVSQIQSTFRSELQKELAEVRARIQQLQPAFDKSAYKEGLMELRAPQAGVIKDLATTTTGAVVQPGAVLMTLVPEGEKLYADVTIRNEDVGFVEAGQSAQIKVATYRFQKYGLLTGKITRISADATELGRTMRGAGDSTGDTDNPATQGIATYKARVQLDEQVLRGPNHQALTLHSGMQVVAEISQGKRSVLEYLLSPVQKIVSEAGREM